MRTELHLVHRDRLRFRLQVEIQHSTWHRQASSTSDLNSIALTRPSRVTRTDRHKVEYHHLVDRRASLLKNWLPPPMTLQ